MKGKCNMELYAIGGIDYGKGILATGRREECRDFKELNGNKRGNCRSRGVSV